MGDTRLKYTATFGEMQYLLHGLINDFTQRESESRHLVELPVALIDKPVELS